MRQSIQTQIHIVIDLENILRIEMRRDVTQVVDNFIRQTQIIFLIHIHPQRLDANRRHHEILGCSVLGYLRGVSVPFRY